MTHIDTDRSTDHDSPWKIALDGYFKEFRDPRSFEIGVRVKINI